MVKYFTIFVFVIISLKLNCQNLLSDFKQDSTKTIVFLENDIIQILDLIRPNEIYEICYYTESNDSLFLNGSCETYKDELLVVKSMFKDNKEHGKSYLYFSKGISEVSTYFNDTLHGEYISYHLDSINNKKTQGFYEKGSKIGLWFSFYEDGQLKSIGNYSGNYTDFLEPTPENYKFIIENDFKGESDIYFVYPYRYYFREGYWYFFDDKGKCIKEEHWKNNKLICSKSL